MCRMNYFKSFTRRYDTPCVRVCSYGVARAPCVSRSCATALALLPSQASQTLPSANVHKLTASDMFCGQSRPSGAFRAPRKSAGVFLLVLFFSTPTSHVLVSGPGRGGGAQPASLAASARRCVSGARAARRVSCFSNECGRTPRRAAEPPPASSHERGRRQKKDRVAHQQLQVDPARRLCLCFESCHCVSTRWSRSRGETLCSPTSSRSRGCSDPARPTSTSTPLRYEPHQVVY